MYDLRRDNKNDTQNLPIEETKTQHWRIISCLPLEFTAIKYIVDKLTHYNGEWRILRFWHYICDMRHYYSYCCWCWYFGWYIYVCVLLFYFLSVLSIVIWQHYRRHHLFEWKKPRNKSGRAHCYFWMFQINGTHIYFFNS